MCSPNYEWDSFRAKGEAKGWSAERINAAWKAWTAKRDAETLNAMPPPEALKAGDLVCGNARAQPHRPVYGGKILAVAGIEAWVELAGGDRDTFALRTLRRMP